MESAKFEYIGVGTKGFDENDRNYQTSFIKVVLQNAAPIETNKEASAKINNARMKEVV